MSKELIEKLLIPFVASNISLLFALMSRNAMVSQRIRDACRELASKDCSANRGQCLLNQIIAFQSRYASTKIAINCVLFAVATFITATVFSNTGVLELLGSASLISSFAAVILTFRDYWRATETLDMEIDFAKSVHNTRKS